MACNRPSPLPDIRTEGLTPESVRANLALWVEASQRLALNQSYRIGDRELRRADLAEVRRMIDFWRNLQADPLVTGASRLPRSRVLRSGCC